MLMVIKILCAVYGPYFKYFACVNSLNSYHNSVRHVPLSFFFYRQTEAWSLDHMPRNLEPDRGN